MTAEAQRTYRLNEILPAERIVQLEAVDKNSALQELLDVLNRTGAVPQPVAAEEAILSREVLMSTGVGYGIALPHARLPSVPDFALALGISATGIPYSTVMDDQPVRLICMIVGPSGQQEDYLRILAMIMKFIKGEKGKVLSAFSLGEVHGFTQGYETAEA